MNKITCLFFLTALIPNTIFASAKTQYLPSSSSSSSISSSRGSISSTTLSNPDDQLSYHENLPIYANQTKLDGLTPFQEITLTKLSEINKSPNEISSLISSYTLAQDPTDYLLETLKDESLDQKTKVERVNEAIAYGANVNNKKDKNLYKNSPLYYCFWDDDDRTLDTPNFEIIKILVKAGANVNVKSSEVFNGINYSIIKYQGLLDSSYFIFKRNPKIQREILDIFELFLVKGADPNIIYIKRNREKGAILLEITYDFLCSQDDISNLKLIELLLKYGANPKNINCDGKNFVDMTKENFKLKELYKKYKKNSCNIL